MSSSSSARAHDRWAMYQRPPGGGRSVHSSKQTAHGSGRLPSLTGRHGATSSGGAPRPPDRGHAGLLPTQTGVPGYSSAPRSRLSNNRLARLGGDTDLTFDIRSYVSPARAPLATDRFLRSNSDKQMIKTVEEEEEDAGQSMSLPEIASRETSLPPIRITPAVLTESVYKTRAEEENEEEIEMETFESDEEICEEADSPSQSPSPQAEEIGKDEHVHSQQAPKKKPVLEFPSCPGKFSLFPVTIMQEHCLIDGQLIQAQLKTHVGSDLHSANDLCLSVDNIVRSYTIQGPLNTTLLEQALRSVAANHPLLRVVFYQYRDNFYGRAAEEMPAFTLECTISGSGNDPLQEERRRPFRLQVHPIDREELIKEHLLCDEDLMLEDENGGQQCLHSPLSGVIEENGLRRTNIITSLEDLLVQSTTKARRIGSALKRRPTSSLLFQQRAQSIDGIPERSSLESTKAQSLMLVAEDSQAATSIINLSTSRRSLSFSQNTVFDGNLPTCTSLWMRGKVVRQLHSPATHRLILTFPRFVADFWSASVFVIEVAKEYTKLENDLSKLVPARSHSRQTKRTSRRVNSRLDQVLSLTSAIGLPTTCNKDSDVALFYAKRQDAKMKQKPNYATENEHSDSVPPVTFQQVALRESFHLKKVSRPKLWSLWVAQATLTVLDRQGGKRTKPTPPLRLPGHVRSEATRRTSLLRSARLRPGTAALHGAKPLFKFLKLRDEITEAYQENLPHDCWKHLPADDPLYLFTLGLFVVVMGHCCRGWDGVCKHQTSVLSNTHLSTEKTSTGSWVNSAGTSSSRALDRPSIVKVRQGETKQGTAPPGAGYFIVGVQLSVRDLSPLQLLPLFGPLTNDACLKVALPLCQTFTDLLLALHKQLKMLKRQLHFPFSSVAEEVGLPGGLPVSFSFLRRRDVKRLTDPEAFYFTETAVGVPGDGLARFGVNCYLQPDNGQMKDGCRLELLLWEMLENESVRGGFRFQPQHIRPSLVDGLVDEFCNAAVVVAKNPSISLQELVRTLRPPFNHRKMRCDRKPSARPQW